MACRLVRENEATFASNCSLPVPGIPALTGIELRSDSEVIRYSGTRTFSRYCTPTFESSQKVGVTWVLPLRLSRTEPAMSRSVRPSSEAFVRSMANPNLAKSAGCWTRSEEHTSELQSRG